MAAIKRIFDLLPNYRASFSKEIMVAGKHGGEWKTYSTDVFLETVDHLSRALAARGIGKGDKIALMSPNRPEWNFCDFAISQLGAATVPLYPTLSSQDLVYILKDADVRMAFVADEPLFEKLGSALQEGGLQLDVFTFDHLEGKAYWRELEEAGRSLNTDLTPYREAVHEDDLHTLIYTSGTTGKPKGVILSHKNVISNVNDCRVLLPRGYTKAISFLPLSHIFERMVVYLYFATGVEVHYAESLDTIVADINEVKPHGFTTVPRVLEKVYDKIVAKGSEQKGLKKNIFFWALNLGLRYKEPGTNGFLYNIQLSIARRLVFSKWQAALGGNIVALISGGAALQERLARVFWAADIPVLEGYGLTETSPVISVNCLGPGNLKFGTVGKVLKSVTVKIASDGEILCKGPNVSKGYYQNEEATAEAFDSEGFLHTGDIGELTEDGFLRITDRKKEMFKTAGGKYVAPQVLENKYMESKFIAQVMVVGENRRFPAALVVPAFDELRAWAKYKGLPSDDNRELVNNQAVKDKYQLEIDRLNTSFGHWEQAKKVAVLPSEWTIDAGELTPKLSLRRKVILDHYKDEIEALYKEK